MRKKNERVYSLFTKLKRRCLAQSTSDKKTCAETNLSYDRRQAKSLHIIQVVSYFYEIQFKIWTGFGPAGSAENFRNSIKVHILLLRVFFYVLRGGNKNKIRVSVHCIVASTLKSLLT